MPSSVAFVDHATLPLFVPDEQGFPPVVLYRLVFTRGLGSKFGAALSENSTGTEWGAAGGVFSVNATIPKFSSKCCQSKVQSEFHCEKDLERFPHVSPVPALCGWSGTGTMQMCWRNFHKEVRFMLTFRFACKEHILFSLG